MFNFRTDLASERRDLYRKANSIENEIQGIESEKEEINENILVERVKITNEEGEKAIGKPQGDYITIDIKKLRIAQDEDIEKSAEVLSNLNAPVSVKIDVYKLNATFSLNLQFNSFANS